MAVLPRFLQLLVPRTLVSRVVTLFGALLILFVGGGLALFLGHQFRHQVEGVQQSSVMLAEVVTVAVQDSVLIGDYDAVRKTLHKAVQASIFESAAFLDMAGGRVEVSSARSDSGSTPRMLIDRVAGQLFDVNRIVNVGGRDYGVLRLKFDAVEVAKDLWGLTVMTAALALGSLAFGLGLIRVLVGRWLGGLSRVHEIDEADLAQRVPAEVDTRAPLEIQRVLELFNRNAALMREREEGRRALDNQKFALDQHAIVSVADPDGTITYANDRFCEISGYPREQLLGHNHRVLSSGVHSPEFFRGLWATIAEGKVWHGEICNRSKSGVQYWVDATIVPLLGADGRPQQYISIRTDITDRKAIEKSLEAARDEAQRSDRAKSAFLANMSHEIRTPLNAILGMLTLLRDTALDLRQLDYTDKTESAARALLGLLNDVLDFSKVEAGMMKLDPAPFRLEHVLRDVAGILAANVGDKDLELLFDIDARLPPMLVGDELRLQQILINLGGNAVKFTQHGHVLLRVHQLGRDATHTRLEFSVTDTGIGIAPEDLGHIFDGFSQAEASTTRRFGGTGLGLALCRRLLELMGGRIDVDSVPGEGSTFRFVLRLPTGPEEVEPTATDAAVAEPLRVLAVDESEVARSVLTSVLTTLGWRAATASSGAAALVLARDAAERGEPFDLVLLDAHLRGQDGPATARQLRRTSALAPRGKVMLLASDARVKQAWQGGGDEGQALDGVLTRPFTAAVLREAVAEVRSGAAHRRMAVADGRARRRRLPGVRLLVVEDNPANQQVARELLQREGAVVTVASNGEQGVKSIVEANPPYDAVLMDVQMPVMDGYMATMLIRQRLGMVDLPIIAMTANAMSTDRDACLAAGMNDHIRKPFHVNVLVETLLRYVGAAATGGVDLPLATATEPGADGAQTTAVGGVASGLMPAEALMPEPNAMPIADDEAEAAPPAAPPLAVELFVLASANGIDLDGALSRMDHEVEIYQDMLELFGQDLVTLPARFRSALAEGEPELAARLMHSVKGTSAMIGAHELHSLAESVEALLRASPGRSLDESVVARLERATARTLAAVRVLHKALASRAVAPVGLPPADPAALRVQLATLAQSLEASDMGAIGLFRGARSGLSTRFAAGAIAPLEQALSQLDFEAAKRHCLDLAKALEP